MVSSSCLICKNDICCPFISKVQTIQWQKTDRQYNGKRRTDNTMAKDGETIQWQKTDRQYNGKRKEVKRQTMVYKTVHRKLDQHGPNIYWGELRCFGRVALLASLLALIVLFGQYRDHDKRNLSVIICDINTPQRLTKSGSRLLYLRCEESNFTTRNHCFIGFLASSNYLSRKS
jgi:hypothetical protein